MSFIIVCFIAGLAAAVLVYRYFDHTRDIGAAVLVLGIAGLAVAVTFVRVEQYRAQQQAGTAAVEELAANTGSTNPGPLRLTHRSPSELTSGPVLLQPVGAPAGDAASPNPRSGE